MSSTNATDSTAYSYFNFTCPDEGNFHICEDEKVQFIGCCTSDPCSNGGVCPTENLRSSSFNGDTYNDLPAQDCSNANGTNNWYTCAFTDPPFLGCCTQSVCGLGQCPQDSLVPARLSDISSNVRRLLSPAGASSTASASATSSSSSDSSSGLSTGAIAGIAVGGAVVGLVALGLLLWCCWLKPRKKKNADAALAAQSAQQHPHPHAQMAQMGQPGSPGTFVPSETPMSHYQASFSSTPTTAHYPSGATDMYGNKLSPYPPSYDRPPSMSTFSDVSAGNRGYGNNGYSPVPMVPVQEMDATSTPHEMSTGQEEYISPQRDYDQQQGYHDQQQGYHNQPRSPRDQLGISP